MRYTEDKPGSPNSAAAQSEELLRRENEDLRRQIQELRGVDSSHDRHPVNVWHPSRLTIVAIGLAVLCLLAGAFVAGYIPLQKRTELIASEARDSDAALPRVSVMEVGRSSKNSGLELPGSIQAVTEAPILARAEGYIQRRLVDIGDRVHAGQTLAEIDVPEMEEQVRQAKANLQQAQAALDQASANLQQGKSELELARVTAQRWGSLAAKGAVSRQENDQYQSQYQAKAASVQALEKAIQVQRSSISASEANLARIEKVQSYRIVRAPFDGVITLRNVDVGALVNAGSTLLFRIAQTGTLRTYVNVPQSHAGSVRPGNAAVLTVANLPGRQFTGTVARSASALDPASRTLLIEVHVPNPDGTLLPGMFAKVDFNSARTQPPLVIPSDALAVGAAGTQVAVVRPDRSVHLQTIEVGRDYGDRLEVLQGLREGDTIILNPGDMAREGLKVNPIPLASDAAEAPAPARAGQTSAR